MTDLRLTKRFAVMLMAGGLVAGCGTSSPTKIDYKSDSKSKQVSLAVPPNMIDETADQRSLPPQGGETSLSTLQQVQAQAPAANTLTVVPQVTGMHIQRDGTESWLVIDNKAPDQAWAPIRRFWQEQGFLLVVDQRDKGVMETDWNETHASINEGLIRDTLSKAMGNSYVSSERNKYRTRLETAPNGGTYVFISQKGMREAITGTNNESTKWEAKPNDPGLEQEYLKRLMAALALADSRTTQSAQLSPAGTQTAPNAATAGAKSAAAATAAQNVALSAQQPMPDDAANTTAAQFSSTELTLSEPYDRAWLRVGLALDRSNFTVDDRDASRGLYFVRYVDPKDLSSAEQGFWSQVFHGKKEKVAKQYLVNVRAVTPDQTRVAVVDDKGSIDQSPQAKQIMGLMVDQLH
ncbi:MULTISPECIES: outer membrane protein assembly factor BamC [Paraburkholderia]|jgi:outer membrane protein assembly factor BamC|uniref:Beta-barrel assembly machine subunit BamC n=1 Tax=Paraburkholderia aspalathi TaxID=1324617 RepID=A0A1I7EK37_9BURK|nr:MULTISPECIES: outer membrane protein assembly factor BamC [Paraburkholderia]MCP2084941.1 outer membrane protein assembly factor BamC [Paraburkholderia sediminicola]MBK3837829.1 outer membrane protein assembly factor BamC [Paraburkholderia aspalathi]MCX4141756.1 outer membrane protein assembly factor BamC [Paraburkholderia aspalathi]MCX4157806.1 outer membrane protein assembly factor BamC [Paraburkholderia aspalathi]MDN7167208.1 outer membrane protein assembly factor BamC [Paraburkholderia s